MRAEWQTVQLSPVPVGQELLFSAIVLDDPAARAILTFLRQNLPAK